MRTICKEQEVKRQEAVKAAAELTQALVDHLNVGVAQVTNSLSQIQLLTF